MLNAQSKTKAQLQACKRCKITTVADVEQTSRVEAKGIIIQALGCGILNQQTSHQELEAMLEMSGTVSPLFASNYPSPEQVATPPGHTTPGSPPLKPTLTALPPSTPNLPWTRM